MQQRYLTEKIVSADFKHRNKTIVGTIPISEREKERRPVHILNHAINLLVYKCVG